MINIISGQGKFKAQQILFYTQVIDKNFKVWYYQGLELKRVKTGPRCFR